MNSSIYFIRQNSSRYWLYHAELLVFLLSGSAIFGQAPVIVTQPESQTIAIGGTAIFSVGVFGQGPFTYQWQFNGTNLLNNIITTVAGNGTGAFADGVSATNTGLSLPYGVSFDTSGNMFIAENGRGRIRKVNTNGIISTVAGGGIGGPGNGDGGQATNASLNSPTFTLPSSGNLFIDDYADNRIRKVNTNGIITAVAGNGTAAFSGDGGPATNASLYSPATFALDGSGNLLIADFRNNRIRRVDTNGIITSIAGKGTTGLNVGSYSGDGGPATNANFFNPAGLALDAEGNMYIADTLNNRIRKIDTNGIVTTVAGNGTPGFSGDGGPATNASIYNPYNITVDSAGNIFFSDNLNNRVREVSTTGNIMTVAGNGKATFSGDGGSATNASLSNPNGIALNGGGVFIADFANNRVREVIETGNPTLTLYNISSSNAGNYTVVVSNASGSVTSAVAVLDVPCGPATATATEANGFVIGATVTYGGCGYTSIPPVTIQGGGGSGATAVAIVSNGAVTGVQITNPGGNYTSNPIVIIGAETAPVSTNCPPATATATLANEFVIGATVTSGGCGYTNTPPVIIQGGGGSGATAVAIVSNGVVTAIQITDAGSNYTTTPNVIIGEGLAILDQPQSLTVYGLGPAFFSVTAQSAGPAAYQWLFDGSNIAGATGSLLTILNATQTNLGTYAVIVSNIFGSVVSSNAVLNMYPYLVGPFSGTNVDLGYTNALSVQAWGTGPLGYQWYFDGAAIAGATSSTYTITNVQFTNGGLYTIVVSNAFGSVTNAPEQVNVSVYPPKVSLRLSPTVVISGVLGNNYIIQRTVAVSNTNSWVTVGQVTLTNQAQLWVDTNIDASQPGNPQQFYQVLSGQ